MGYVLGIDLGTSYAAAAIDENGRTEIVQLGSRAAVIPSLVVLRADGEVLTGEAAERRSYSEPARTAREFKRRLGDPTPIILGGTPYGAESVMALLLKAVVQRVVEQRGEPPALIAITHPASYGAFKLDLLAQAIRQADIGETIFLSEPEAAAIHYSEQERVETGTVVAIYDFGGGTFDASVLRKTAEGFELLGRPEGMERLGGTDFDEAVFQHVLTAIRDQTQGIDPNSTESQTAFIRIREECREAKEALSADTEAVIPVALPNLHTDVRITRSEFESIVTPRVRETVSALERSVRSASLAMTDIDRILLVGGTSRIPIVGAIVREATGRPVAADAHPKHAVALGAAIVARRHQTEQPADAKAIPAVVAAVPPVALESAPAESPETVLTPPPVFVEAAPDFDAPPEIVMTPPSVFVEPAPDSDAPPEIVMTPPPMFVEPPPEPAESPRIELPPQPVFVEPAPEPAETPQIEMTPPPVSVEPEPEPAGSPEIVVTPPPVFVEPTPEPAKTPEVEMTPPPVFVEPTPEPAKTPEVEMTPPPVFVEPTPEPAKTPKVVVAAPTTVFAAPPPEDEKPAPPVVPEAEQILFTAPPAYSGQAGQGERLEPAAAPVWTATAASEPPQSAAVAAPITPQAASSPPPPASPPAQPSPMGSTPGGGNRRMMVIGGAAAAVAVALGAGLAFMLGGSDEPDSAASVGETATATSTASESPTAEPTDAATAEPTATLPPDTPTLVPATATNTVPPATPTLAPNTSRIGAIEVADGRYSVGFEVAGFTPQVASQHVHFFFDTVPPAQAGVPGGGPWFLYGGPSPFTGYAVTERPPGATQLCILVARPDHSVIQDTGNCVQLP